MSNEVVIVQARRTPIGKFGGSLASLSAIELGGLAIKAVLEGTPVDSDQLDEVIMGMVVTAGVGQIPARQAAAKAGLATHVKALHINKVCASGMKAVGLAAQAIRSGDRSVMVAGGMESMSNTPYLLPKARWGMRMGDSQMVDAMIHDGLWCSFHDVHMILHGSNVARETGISRAEQDEWALRSHLLAAKAHSSGRFANEISPVTLVQKKGDPIIVSNDESVRGDSTLEKLASLKPVMDKEGSITAGNAPGINDGAAALLLMSRAKADELGLKPLARIVSYGEVADDYPYLAHTPANAIKDALQRAQMNIGQLDLIEINEAFAAVTLLSTKMLEVSPDIVNVNGGAIAMGHPIGASGARLVSTLVHELIHQGKRFGAAGICSGAAQGDAIIVENLTL